MAEAERSDAAWRKLAEKAVGASLDTLGARTAEGLAIAPLYLRRPDDPPQPWRGAADWSVAQRVDHPDADEADRLALLDLEGGADSLVLVGGASPFARGFGRDGAFGLEGIELDLIGLRLDAGPGTRECLTTLADLAVRRTLTSAALAVDVGYDPIGWGARLGQPPDDATSAILDLRAKAGLGGTAVLADGRPWHEAGAGEAQELAAVLATAVAYLRRLEGAGLSLDDARRTIALLLAMDADVILGTAKIRALRRLWTRVETACGLAPRPVRLHAETSWRMMTRHDPWTNVMRATAAVFAAGIGGADVITALPFTLPLGLPDAAGRRLARNLQRVLLDESHLGKVADPTAGAGGFEALTDELCRAAWTLFQEIEREGGMERAIQMLRQQVAATARARASEIGALTRGIVGTSRFAVLDTPLPAVLDVAPRPAREPGPDALPAHRDAAPFEALRERAEGLDEGRRQVFLATLGPPAAFGPRATYASNFFAAAGLRAGIGIAARDVDALVAAFAASGAATACLCGTDEAYATEATPLAAGLRAAGARRILLVGRANGLDTDIDALIHDGCDALQILAATLDAIST